jgi:hypothetical protein
MLTWQSPWVAKGAAPDASRLRPAAPTRADADRGGHGGSSAEVNRSAVTAFANPRAGQAAALQLHLRANEPKYSF